MSQMYYTRVPSPVDELLLVGSADALQRIEFAKGVRVQPPQGAKQDAAPFAAAMAQLEEYFDGSRRRFEVPLALHGTEFQRATWEALLSIPYGETRTYGEIAKSIGRPTAVRAVGAANGQNPIPIIVPCHRVIGANGTLTGFGGGLPTKQYLLELEQGQAKLRLRSAPARATRSDRIPRGSPRCVAPDRARVESARPPEKAETDPG